MSHASFSHHAWKRVEDRLTLTPSEVAEILNWDLAVTVGKEQGTSRAHRLFYSEVDDMCFVAIQDTRDGTVITVLPWDYHNRWRISDEALTQAQHLIRGSSPTGLPTAAAVDAPQQADVPPTSFRLSAYFVAQGKLRCVNLGSWPTQPYESRPERLQEDAVFHEAMKQRLQQKSVTPREVQSLIVKLGKNGTVSSLELR